MEKRSEEIYAKNVKGERKFSTAEAFLTAKDLTRYPMTMITQVSINQLFKLFSMEDKDQQDFVQTIYDQRCGN